MDKILVEWVSPPYYTEQEPFCPWCGNFQSDGHREDCNRQIAAFGFIPAEREIERLQSKNAQLAGLLVRCYNLLHNENPEPIRLTEEIDRVLAGEEK